MNKIFELQAELQETYDDMGGMLNPQSLTGLSVGHTLDYIRDMKDFMLEEVNELMIEIGDGREALKPWSSKYDELRSRDYEPTDHVRSEAVDMLCFALNICLAAGVDGSNIRKEYLKVYRKNKERQLNGY
jgi:NTP pyrophosphatase (non-canonical NTP hydrolase)|tara:strand:- start:3598 stop:3987 length:390 start_codon:yes stop_codon:yes gene_type:complete